MVVIMTTMMMTMRTFDQNEHFKCKKTQNKKYFQFRSGLGEGNGNTHLESSGLLVNQN